MTRTLTAPTLMQKSYRIICYTDLLRDPDPLASGVTSHIVSHATEDDRCSRCGGEDWSGFDVMECPACGEWAVLEDAEMFRAWHGCFGGSL